MGKMLEKIDEAANNWNKTKDFKYKDLWYKLIKEYVNGTTNLEQRPVSINSSDKKNVRGNSFNKQY